MPVSLHELVMVVVIASLGALALVVLARALLFRRLQSRHPVLWQDLGNPRLMVDPTREKWRKVHEFLRDSARHPRNDRTLAALLVIIQLLNVFVVLSLLLLFPVVLADVLVQRLDPPAAERLARVCWLLLFVAGFTTVVATALLFRHLREGHQGKWRELGEPSFFSQRRFRIFRYLWFGEHRAVGDRKLNLLVLLIRGLTLLGVFSFVLAVSVNKMIGIAPSLW